MPGYLIIPAILLSVIAVAALEFAVIAWFSGRRESGGSVPSLPSRMHDYEWAYITTPGGETSQGGDTE